nr:restriction endonuclease subunit S [Bifidobacterium longum]
MMTEQAKVPEIRFAGFTDPWEQRKASEVFQIVDDRGHPTLPVLSATQNQGMIYRDDSGRYIGHDESNEIGYKRVLPGDFVVHLRSFQGGFAHSQYEGITSPAYTVFRAKEPTSHSDRFWKHWFMSEHFIAGLSTVTYGIRDGRSISVDEFMNTFLAFPAVEEQAAISRLFDYLDDLITLHQRKYDKLVVFKKSMLEKMFPKDGESVPEIRFAGFTDPWEQRKLGELTESYSGGTPAAGESEFYGGSIPFIRSAEIAAESTELFLTEKGYESSSARMVKPGDVLYALYGATSGEVAVSRQKGAINQAILAILPRDDCDARYITAWLRKQKGYIVTTYLQGGQGNLSGVIVKNLEVSIPSLPEQQKIGFMLSHLDSLITLHQRKLELLQNIKKSLLDKMFA